MIQITRPVAASRKGLRISGGRILDPPSPPCRMPPRESQIARRTKPPPAVSNHAINAAHSIYASLRRTRVTPGGSYESPAPAVRDRRPAVASERFRRQPHAGRCLAALVLGPVNQPDGAVDHVGVEPVRAQLLERAVLLDVGLEPLGAPPRGGAALPAEGRGPPVGPGGRG